MTIKYCDYAAGDDSIGTGSNSSPYKTIQKASTGLTANDVVRIAKSSAATTLAGTCTFTNNSTYVNTSSNQMSVVAVGDFINVSGSTAQWKEVTARNASVITMASKWYGTTGSKTGIKCGVTNTGSAAAANTVVQYVNSSGDSTGILTISGGWDLSTETQTGETYFWQSNANRYGYGLDINAQSYIKIEDVGFLKYSSGIINSVVPAYNIQIDNCRSICGNVAIYAYEIYRSEYNRYAAKITNCDAESIYSNGSSGAIALYDSPWSDISNCTTYNGYGIKIYTSGQSLIENTTHYKNTSYSNYGIYLDSSYCTISNCNSGVYFELGSGENYILDMPSISKRSSNFVNSHPFQVAWMYDTASGINRSLTRYGGLDTYIKKSPEGSGYGSGKCLMMYSDTGDDLAFPITIPVKANRGITLSFYAKISDISTPDSVFAQIWFQGEDITSSFDDYDEDLDGIPLTLTSTWTLQEIYIDPDYITEDSLVEFRIYANDLRNGAVYIDQIDFEHGIDSKIFTIAEYIAGAQTETFSIDIIVKY